MDKDEQEELEIAQEYFKKKMIEELVEDPDFIHVHGKGYDPDES